MIYSSERKLRLSGWLQENGSAEYEDSLKLQKFLFFYEAFCKVNEEVYDFSHLRGFINGPVFSQVWGDYTKDRLEFNLEAKNTYEASGRNVNERIAKKCGFLVKTLTGRELSRLTHEMNIWNAKASRIRSGEYMVNLNVSDFNAHDEQMIKILDSMYSDELVNNSIVISVDKNSFVFPQSATNKLKESHMDTMLELTENENLHNPVFVDIDEEGRLIVD